MGMMYPSGKAVYLGWDCCVWARSGSSAPSCHGMSVCKIMGTILPFLCRPEITSSPRHFFLSLTRAAICFVWFIFCQSGLNCASLWGILILVFSNTLWKSSCRLMLSWNNLPYSDHDWTATSRLLVSVSVSSPRTATEKVLQNVLPDSLLPGLI